MITWDSVFLFVKEWGSWALLLLTVVTAYLRPFKKPAAYFTKWIKTRWSERKSKRVDGALAEIKTTLTSVVDTQTSLIAGQGTLTTGQDSLVTDLKATNARLEAMDLARDRARQAQIIRDDFCNFNERDRHEAQIAFCSGFMQLGTILATIIPGAKINGEVVALYDQSTKELARLRQILADQHQRIIDKAKDEGED